MSKSIRLQKLKNLLVELEELDKEPFSSENKNCFDIISDSAKTNIFNNIKLRIKELEDDK